MTPDDIRRKVRQIERLGIHDPEVAHIEEDGLWEEVLRAIAAEREHSEARALARAALKTKRLPFDRWYA